PLTTGLQRTRTGRTGHLSFFWRATTARGLLCSDGRYHTQSPACFDPHRALHYCRALLSPFFTLACRSSRRQSNANRGIGRVQSTDRGSHLALTHWRSVLDRFPSTGFSLVHCYCSPYHLSRSSRLEGGNREPEELLA